jgi:hypothetical protein
MTPEALINAATAYDGLISDGLKDAVIILLLAQWAG